MKEYIMHTKDCYNFGEHIQLEVELGNIGIKLARLKAQSLADLMFCTVYLFNEAREDRKVWELTPTS